MSAASISSAVTLSASSVSAGSPVTAICTITNSGTAPTNPGYVVRPTVAVHSGSPKPNLPVVLRDPVISNPIIQGSDTASGVTVVTFTVIPGAPLANSPDDGSASLIYDIGATVNAVDSSTGAPLQCTSTVANLTVTSLF